MNIDLQGKKAMVCGSTRGIGRAVARQLDALGAEIILVARNETELKKVVAELDGSRKHAYIVADFNQPEELKKSVEEFLSGNGPVHILVNNTGGPPGGPVTQATTEEFIKAFLSHLICNHILAQSVIEGMKKSGFGRIINIISTSVKQPLKGLGVSNTVRAAVANWSKTWSNEVAAAGVTVNNVLPGATRTDRLESLIEAKAIRTKNTIKEIEEEMLNEIPMRRFATPDEIANAVAFLASPAASYITGINIPVDGGRTSSL
jgi:3-oxoacyl-[acyl-carrier protein] reductase